MIPVPGIIASRANTTNAHLREQMDHSHFNPSPSTYNGRPFTAGLSPILYDLYGLAQVAGWELYRLHDLQPVRVSWVGSAL